MMSTIKQTDTTEETQATVDLEMQPPSPTQPQPREKPPDGQPSEPPERRISIGRRYLIIATISCVTFLSSTYSGLMVISLPSIARDLNLAIDLLLWPAAVSSLSCGCTLLLFGSISDIVGGRRIYLLGSFLLTGTTIACGLSRTGVELIIFRTAQGLAMALCLPSSVLLVTSNIPQGNYRNFAFACLGAGQPIGFGFGLIVGGFFIQRLSWRCGYYLAGGLTFAVFLCAMFALPADAVESQPITDIWVDMKRDIDWVGCLLMSTCNGLLLYLLSVFASGPRHLLTSASLSLSVVALLLIPAVYLYLRRQERLGRKVIIPPSLWSNKVFTSLCVIVFIVWGCFNATQYFIALYFQEIQGLSAIQTAIRFLPQVVIGLGTSLFTGWLVKCAHADLLILGSGIITAICPLLMANVDPNWSYWSCSFFALCCIPICGDVLFTVGNLLTVSLFPDDTGGLAGGIFNTVSNLGNSFGLATAAVVAVSVTNAESSGGKDASDSLMAGYRASFLAGLVSNVFVLIAVCYGLRGVGKVGIKDEDA